MGTIHATLNNAWRRLIVLAPGAILRQSSSQRELGLGRTSPLRSKRYELSTATRELASGGLVDFSQWCQTCATFGRHHDGGSSQRQSRDYHGCGIGNRS